MDLSEIADVVTSLDETRQLVSELVAINQAPQTTDEIMLIRKKVVNGREYPNPRSEI